MMRGDETMTKTAIVITDGLPEDYEITAIILMDKKDVSVYDKIILDLGIRGIDMIIGRGRNAFEDIVRELEKLSIEYELITDIEKDERYYYIKKE